MIKQEQIKTKLNAVKGTIKELWSKYSENDFALTKERMSKISENVSSRVDQGKSMIKQRGERKNAGSDSKVPSVEEQNIKAAQSAPLARDENIISASEIEEVGADGVLDTKETEGLISNSNKKRSRARKKDGVKYYQTENSEFAVGAEKVTGGGIDSFGEEDTFDPDEADDHQTFRDRKQNSDLNKRFGTKGLDIDLDAR